MSIPGSPHAEIPRFRIPGARLDTLRYACVDWRRVRAPDGSLTVLARQELLEPVVPLAWGEFGRLPRSWCRRRSHTAPRRTVLRARLLRRCRGLSSSSLRSTRLRRPRTYTYLLHISHSRPASCSRSSCRDLSSKYICKQVNSPAPVGASERDAHLTRRECRDGRGQGQERNEQSHLDDETKSAESRGKGRA